MTTGRGREARIRPQYAALYGGLQPAEWKPVEAILRRVAELSPEDRASAGVSAGSRPLKDEHFEFRGVSPRPEGSSPRLSRATDAGGDPERMAGLKGQLNAEQEQLTAQEREAEQTIARAEHLRERADALRQDFERLRQRAAELDLRGDRQQGDHPEGPAPQAERPGEPGER
jgi:hypothetical protein